MKLYFDKRLKDPTYYGQQGFRNGKKVTSKNIKKFGKHSELLKITDDPESYVREEIRKWNEEYRPNPIVEMGLFLDGRGIPVSMCLHPGNTSEQVTAVPLEKEILKMTPENNP